MSTRSNAPREYQAIGEPHVGFVACQECFAVVVAGDRAAHDEWHESLIERAAAPLRRLAALSERLEP